MQVGSAICDTVARIKNGFLARKASIMVIKSKFVISVLKVIKSEGYISNYFIADKSITVYLKYDQNGSSVIRNITSVSKPSLRKYVDKKGLLSKELFGIHIISSNRGVMSGVKAHSLGIGGEVLLEIC